MSTQYSNNIFSHRSLYLFPTPFSSPLKAYPYKLRSRNRTLSSTQPLVLIATTEHPDGSLVFRFGDASKMVEEIESKIQQESSIYEEQVLSSQSVCKMNNSLEVLVDETDPEGTLTKNNVDDDETEDSSLSVMLESMQVSKDEVVDVKQPYDENELDKVKTEDTHTQGLMPISDVEFTYAANDYMEEGLKIDEIPSPSDILIVEPTLDEVEVTMEEVSTIEAVYHTDHAIEDELQEVSTSNREDNDVSSKEDAEIMVEEDEVSQIQSDSLELNPTMQISSIELEDITGRYPDDGILEFKEESDELSLSVDPETIKVSDIELEDTRGKYPDDGILQVKEESDDLSVSVDSETIKVSDIEIQDTMCQNLDDIILQVIEESEDPSVEIFQVSNIELQDTMGQTQNTDDGFLQVKDQSKDPLVSVKLETMQVSNIEVIDFEGEVATFQNLDDGILQVINEKAGDSLTMDVEQSSDKLEDQPVQDDGVNHNMLEQCAETDAPECSILQKQDAHDLILEAEQNKENVSSSELAEASEDTALLLATEAKVKREEIYLTGEFLSSGAALLEHPFKALTGGDDAYFVVGGKWLGVANGVRQWSFEGTDPGVYAQELMRTCEDIVLDTTSVPVTNPVELLCRGVKETNMSGSANVLIASFYGQFLHVANIGDTGFLIIRHGAIYKKSSPLLHEFHFALQVEDSDDPLQLVEECRIELEEGDIVVSATDGLFDNLYEREIAMIVSKSLQEEMNPQEIANVLATRVQEVGNSAFVRSPFSDAAQAAGYTGYTGGKPDNVAVIVSLVEKISNLPGE